MKISKTVAVGAIAFMFAWVFAPYAGVAAPNEVLPGSLVSGSIRVGAYDVDVQNASRTNWVNGDLVLVYLNTNANVAKSFSLPRPTQGRLLAVGGGGAGGQERTRDESYGLPGGGGAGGLVANDNQVFSAATYRVTVGAGGVAPRSTSTKRQGADGNDSTVTPEGSSPIARAKGGGGGGVQAAGRAGGCGGGGSAASSSSSGRKSGGNTNQSSQGIGPGTGYKGGAGNNVQCGAGGGAGGPGVATSSTSSGSGGPGVTSNITGADVVYACGGAGGSTRVMPYFYIDDSEAKVPVSKLSYVPSGRRGYLFDARDGAPGRNGFGDGGGGSGYYDTSSSPTFAGSGGSGAVIVRIPPYSIFPEDAISRAFPAGSISLAEVGGKWVATLQRDIQATISLPDNIGAVEIALNGHSIAGADGAAGNDITPGGNGLPALEVVTPDYPCTAGTLDLSVTGSGSLRGGNGGVGYPGGTGAPAVRADGIAVNLAPGIGVVAGTSGESLVQHPHEWSYTVEDGKIVATCTAAGDCSYKIHKPFAAISAGDAPYTALRYDKLSAVNGLTPVTGVVVSPETYVGRGDTVYPESVTPPTEQGTYTVRMSLNGMTITSDFSITELTPAHSNVYQSAKVAERKGRDVRIVLSATFDGSRAINDGNILLLGSRCNAHSMATGTVEKTINALTDYADVRWYAYGSSDANNNLTNQLTRTLYGACERQGHGRVRAFGGVESLRLRQDDERPLCRACREAEPCRRIRSADSRVRRRSAGPQRQVPLSACLFAAGRLDRREGGDSPRRAEQVLR